MPELPEVETVRRGLAIQLIGSSIKSVKVLRNDSIGCPATAEFVKLLSGRSFSSINRRGKYLLMDLDEQIGLAAHLRMSGRLLVLDCRDEEPSHVRVRFLLADGRKLVFDDTRVFGRLWAIRRGQTFEDVVPSLKLLGPEPLEGIDPDHLIRSFEGKTQCIKTALLDQTIIAGIGNIYADESLYKARIRPSRPAGDLSRIELKRLSKEIQLVLENAIVLGGSTLRDYTDSSGVDGNYQHEALVYGRKDQPCRSCKSKIHRIKLAGRSSHFCPRCQK